MGMFKNMMDKIFRGAANAEAPMDAAKPGEIHESRVAAARRQGVPVGEAVPGAPGTFTGAGSAAGMPGTAGSVDVAAVLDGMAAKNNEKLDWKHSIVDLMTLLDMDSSIAARRDLAADLSYTGDTNDSASMNIWLHKQVMKKLAENGGNVPADLLAR